MNQQQWVQFAVFVFVVLIGVFIRQSLRSMMLPTIRRWVQPLVDRLFPGYRFEPWLFEPIAAEQLPADQRQYFESHTPDYLVRGFTLLGDFVIRRDNEPSCVRYFLSRDRTVIGEIVNFLGTHNCGCMSVLLDGFYIESANVKVDDLPPADHGLAFCIVDSSEGSDVIEQHVACVAETAAARGSQPAVLDPADMQGIVNYGRQLSIHSLVAQGVLSELPEFLRKQQPSQTP